MLQPGDLLGPYRIEREIGRGGMAVVYLATHQRLDRPVALKVLHAHLQSNEAFVERFLFEARAAARLDHFNIVRVHDAGHIDGVDYIAMEFVEGESLAEILQRVAGPLPLDFSLSVLKQVAAALDYAHARGIVHRDIKPSNILVRDNGHALLTDFGIARAASHSDQTQTGTIVGTPEYMSPEQATGRVVDGRSDVYSLGVVAFHMLTGRPPFRGENAQAILYAHVHQPLPDPLLINPELPQAIAPVLAVVTAKEPYQRYPTASAFVQALSAATGAMAAPSKTSPVPIEKPALAGPSPWLYAGILFFLLLAALSLTGYFILQSAGQAPPPSAPPQAPSPVVIGGPPTAAPVVVRATDTPTASPTPENAPTPLIAPSATPTATPNRPPRIAYVSDRTGDPQIFLIQSDGDNDIQLTFEGRNEHPFWAADGSLIFFTSDRSGRLALWSMRPDGSEQTELLSADGAIAYSLSPNGQHVAFARLQDEQFDIFLDSRPWVSLPGNQTAYVWSPDSQRILFESIEPAPALYLIGVDETTPRPLTDASYSSWNPTWAPDSRRFAFASTLDGNAGIYRGSLDAPTPLRMTPLDVWSQAPSWSPDAQFIAHIRGEEGDVWGLYLINADGGERFRLFGPVFSEAPAVWSNDGQHLAFIMMDGDRELAVIRRDGSGFRQLTSNRAAEWDPAWEPHGR
ncbi:MAG: protein kinase [Chloroflexi bacterium]|nr:protein kinase [Chloroflexota bacterium]